MAIDYTKRKPSAPAGGVSLSKVTLTKSAPIVSLNKRGAVGGQMRVNLQWSAGGTADVDLDLACLWEFTDGTKGVVQALGNSFQARGGGKPVIRLDGDDRSGSNSGGENLYIDLGELTQIRKILVFAYIYEGAPNWASADAVVTLFPAGSPEIEVRLDEPDSAARSCAIAMLENNRSELTVRREVRYIRGTQSEIDKAYRWGMKWTSARK